MELLVQMAADGAIEYEELQKLTEWLNDHSKLEIPAIRFMFELMIRICEDARIADEEIFEIQLAIERVLPKDFRTKISQVRKSGYYNQPASENQLDLIENLSHIRPTNLTRQQASERIDELFSNPPASNRQLMFLRFWNRLDLAQLSRREISDWMDAFIQEDYARWLAWDLFKQESGDDGSQKDPSFVPLGAADSYLKKVYEQHV